MLEVVDSRSSGGSERVAEPDRRAELGCAESEALGGKICTAAGLAAQADAQLIELIGQFDAGNAVRWWQGVKSLAHWLCWACSMSPGTAREHIRVARALPRMPAVSAAFAEGRLSYSKVREVTRVVDTVDDAQLCELALQATAAQLAKTVSGYRTAAGRRVKQEQERRLTWIERESGAVDLRLRLPKEEAATFLAALNAAKDQYGTPPEPLDVCSPSDASPASGPESSRHSGPDIGTAADPAGARDSTPTYTLAHAALDVARVFLTTATEDRSGEDRTLVVVHVNADELAHDAQYDVPAGTSRAQTTGSEPTEPPPAEPQPTEPRPTEPQPTESATDTSDQDGAAANHQDVPAGTSATSSTGTTAPPSVAASSADAQSHRSTPHHDPTSHIQGVGGVEPETARKLACDADLLGAIIDAHCDVLALGRTRRLVSKAQRRALMIRDQGRCQFTACHQTRHLKAHHLVHWFDGGPTDLDNLILLCQFHHTAVHEGQLTIRRVDPAPDSGAVRRWEFLMPDGTPHKDWWSAEGLLNFLAQHADRRRAELERARRTTVINSVRSFQHPDARRIQPGWCGERFDRHEAVQALFRMPVESPVPEAA